MGSLYMQKYQVNSLNPQTRRRGKKRKHGGFTDKANEKEDDSGKRLKGNNPNKWHPKLKAALQDSLKKAGNSSFSKILTYIGKGAEEVYL